MKESESETGGNGKLTLIGTKVWSPTFNSKNITVQTRHTRNTTVYIQRQRFSLLKALNALA